MHRSDVCPELVLAALLALRVGGVGRELRLAGFSAARVVTVGVILTSARFPRQIR